MNELLIQFAKEAGLEDSACPLDTWENPELAKFAELIIRECCNEVEFQLGGGRELPDGSHSQDWDDALRCVVVMIEHRFK